MCAGTRSKLVNSESVFHHEVTIPSDPRYPLYICTSSELVQDYKPVDTGGFRSLQVEWT